MDDFMIWSVPLAFFLCIAAVQTLRKHWHNALSAVLAAGLSLAIMACAGQDHTTAMLRARRRHYETKIDELKRQLSRKEEESSSKLDIGKLRDLGYELYPTSIKGLKLALDMSYYAAYDELKKLQEEFNLPSNVQIHIEKRLKHRKLWYDLLGEEIQDLEDHMKNNDHLFYYKYKNNVSSESGRLIISPEGKIKFKQPLAKSNNEKKVSNY